MEESQRETKINSDDMKTLKHAIEENKPKFGLITFLLFIIASVGIFICIDIIRERSSSELVDSSNRVLIVSWEQDIPEAKSDKTQVSNALENGGMIRLDSSDLDSSLGVAYESYGATNGDGRFWVFGAVLNYISSRGWTLVQAPSSGLSDEFYFAK